LPAENEEHYYLRSTPRREIELRQRRPSPGTITALFETESIKNKRVNMNSIVYIIGAVVLVVVVLKVLGIF
jgi:hypothetical protein